MGNVVDLFCGAGGMSEGFKMAGFDIVLAIEANEVAAATHKANNPDSKMINRDIRKVSSEEILRELDGTKIDVVIGGPPCQGFSAANRRKKRNDRRNGLFREYARVVKAIGPEFFVMENVGGMLKAKPRGKTIPAHLEELLPGYSMDSRLLMAADFGVPQMRRRAIIIGRKGKGTAIPFPERTHARPKKDEITGLPTWKTVAGILIQKDKAPKELYYSKKLIKGFKRRARKNRQNGVGFKWQFLNPDKPSYTIPARYYKDGANALVKYSDTKIRKLDWAECARIQSFPAGYVFEGSRRRKYEQIGNAVPPLLSYNIAKVIKEALE